MKRFILIGSLLCAFLLLLTPQLSAAQYTLVTENQEQVLQDQLATHPYFSMLPETKQEDLCQTFYSILSGDISAYELRTSAFSFADEPGDEPPQPMFFTFLGLLYSLIVYLVVKVIGTFLRNVGFLVAGFLGNVLTLIGGLVSILISVFGWILNWLFNSLVATGEFLVIAVQMLISLLNAGLLGVFNLFVKTGEFIVNGIVLVLSGILSTVLFILTGLYRMLERLWIGVGTFFGLVLEVLRLIYDIIFPFATS